MGKNLHVLSQIEGVDLDMYKESVLPRVLEQVSLLMLRLHGENMREMKRKEKERKEKKKK